MPSDSSAPIRLTQTVKKGGCAAKIPALELRKILSMVNFPPAPPELLVDGRGFDDAAVYAATPDHGERVGIVQTIDFFTPILDSPFDFGRVAAANALSDVFAMGGRPVTALAVLAFPAGVLPNSTIVEVMNGACDVLSKAGAALAGGHSIDDDTLKFGLSVTGLVRLDRVWSNAGARPGNTLILTKALGTGTLTAALKREALSEDDIRDAIEGMAQLNDVIRALRLCGEEELALDIHAATDITGFGLAGHAMQMAKASGVGFEINSKLLPILPRAEQCLHNGFLTKAHRSNADYVGSSLRAAETLSEISRLLCFDPQTSGGLLLSVSAERADRMVAALRTEFTSAVRIGFVSEKHPGELAIR